MARNSKHIAGDCAEAIAVLHYLKNGYSVFTTTQGNSPCDLVVLDPNGNVELIDVKTLSRRTDNSKIYRVLSKIQKAANIKFAYVDLKTNKIHFD
jgi:Holliday junction resolvase-like predicted endonuclease|tara:strand:+ start:204 stop:488 length:285 start_codon:yes stop_codon:yes gene_type:complete